MKRVFIIIINFMILSLTTGTVQAQELIQSGSTSSPHAMYLALAASFAIGVAAFGGALAQGRAASSALEGIARNPEAAGKIMTPMIIGLALIESLVIYALVIAFLLQAKI